MMMREWDGTAISRPLSLLPDADASLGDAGPAQIAEISAIGPEVVNEPAAREALAASEMRLRSALEIAEIGCWEYDVETGENHWDEALMRIMRAPAGSGNKLGNTWTEVIHPDDRQRVIESFSNAIKSRSPYRAEFRIRAFDGEERVFSARGGFAGPRLFVGVAYDVTEARRFQRELEQSEAKFRETFDQAAVGMAHVGLDGQWLRVNRRLCSMLGYSEAELLQKNFQELTHPDDLAADLANAADIANGRRATYSMEKRYTRKDGSVLWANLTVSLLRDKDGNPLHYISVVEDATARKNAEAAQALSEQRWRTLAHALPHLVWTCRPDGSCDYLSPQWEEYTGASAKEQLEFGWITHVHPEDRDHLLEKWNESVRTHTMFECEARVRRADGVYRWFKKRAIAIKDETGVVQWFGTSTDITSVIDARQVLERSASELESLVNERTKALRDVNDRLARTEKLGALGKLAGGIAHDFNNVLQAVKGGSDLISRRTADENIRKMARMMSEAADRGSSITRRLLAFSRKGELRTEPVAIPRLLESISEVLAHTFPANIAVSTHIARDVPVLPIDRGHLEVALLNLATNARDAMPEGGALTIAVAPEYVGEACRDGLAPGNYLRISVSDTGIGIDPALMSRIAEPFFTTKPEGQGTGLGLAMVRAFAEQIGGRFTLESTQNVGTTATLILPVTRSALDQEAPQLPSGNSVSRVLVVDDDRLVRELLMTQLTEAGYEVLAADSAETAMVIIEDVPDIDVVVSDYAMTGMDGIGLIKQLRNMGNEVPVLLLTGNYARDPELMENFGARLLRKPASILELVRAIEDLALASPAPRSIP